MTITKNHRCPHCGRTARITFKALPGDLDGVRRFRGYHLCHICRSQPIYIEWVDVAALAPQARRSA